MRHTALSAVFLFIGGVLLLQSCASVPRVETAAEILELSGKIEVSGPDPFNRTLFLGSDDIGRWKLEAPLTEGELVKLDGHWVIVEGISAGRQDAGNVFIVRRYRLLPIHGMLPVCGILGLEGGTLVLADIESGETIMLTGPLIGALEYFAGHKGWIWGERTEGPADSIEVSGYEILGTVE